MAMTISEQTYINNAINRARSTFDNAIASSRRNAERMGINPNSGRYAALEQDAQYSKAAGMASTGNEASFNWLKQAQDQANKDADLQYRYSAMQNEQDLANARLEQDLYKYRNDLALRKKAAEAELEGINREKAEREKAAEAELEGINREKAEREKAEAITPKKQKNDMWKKINTSRWSTNSIQWR